MVSDFSKQAIAIMKSIPAGKVSTYGRIAALAGDNRSARQVSRLLNSCSEKENIPWYRIVNNRGKISLRPGNGYELQKALLEAEGVEFDENDMINFQKFLWQPSLDELEKIKFLDEQFSNSKLR